MQRRLRLTLLGIAAVVVALIVALIVATYVMLQPQRFTDLLRAQARKAGLNLALSRPAEPTLWPQPAVVLHGLTLTANNRPVLIAARARLVVPWRMLLGGPPTITRLELDAPRINLAQLGPILSRMQHGKAGPPVLPHVDAGIRVSHGSLVRGNEVLLGDIRLVTGPLTPDHAFHLQLAAKTAHGHPATLTLTMTPHAGANVITFDDIRTTASGPSGLGWVLTGHAVWRGGGNLALTLAGTLTRSHKRHYGTTLSMTPPNGQTPRRLHVKLGGPGLDADLHLSPSQLIAWWHTVSTEQAPADIPLPPLTGSISASKLTLDGTTIEGLRLTTDTPAPATSVSAAGSSAPAAASSVPATGSGAPTAASSMRATRSGAPTAASSMRATRSGAPRSTSSKPVPGSGAPAAATSTGTHP